MKVILLIVFFILPIHSKCILATADKTEYKILEPQTIHCTEASLFNKDKLCLETTTIQRNKAGSNPFQIFCLHEEHIVTGYPTLHKFGTVKSSYSDSIFTTGKMIVFKGSDNLIFYSIAKKKFTTFHIENYRNARALSDNQVLLEYYSPTTKSYDIMILDTNTFQATIIPTPFDDYISNIYYNNNFVLKQIPNRFTNVHGADVNHTLLPNVKKFTLPHKEQSDYIIDKHFNIISYKPSDATKMIHKAFDELNGTLVHGKASLAILAFSLLSLIFIFVFIKQIAESYKLPIITSFFMLAYIIFVYIGAVSLNVGYFEYEYNTHLYERKDLLWNIWIYATAGLYLIPLGAYISKKLLTRNKSLNIDTFFEKDINYNFNEKWLLFAMMFLFLLSIAVLLLYFTKLDTIPIFGVFQHLLPEQLVELRSNSGNNFVGKVYRYVIFYRDIPLLLLLISFIMKNQTKVWKVFFFSLLIYNIFVHIMDLSKGPLINLILILLLLYFFIKKEIEWRKLFIILAISFILLIIMYIAFMGMSRDGFLSTLAAPFHRAFIGSISPLFWWQLYIEQHGYLHGLTLPNPHHIFPFEHLKMSVATMDFAHPHLKDLHIVGSLPVVFFAEWFANFGWGIAVISMLLFGMLLFTIDYMFIAAMLKNKNPILLGLYVYIMFHFKSYAVTSISGIVFNTHLWVPVIISIILLYISKNRPIRKTI